MLLRDLRQAWPRRRTQLRTAGLHMLLEHTELREDRRDLECAADAELRAPESGPIRDVAPCELDAARRHTVESYAGVRSIQGSSNRPGARSGSKAGGEVLMLTLAVTGAAGGDRTHDPWL